MVIPRRIERPYRVRFDEAGADGHLRSSGFLRYAQDVAWIHSEEAGFDRRWYRLRGLQWLVRCVEVDVVERVEYGASLQVSTEVLGWRRVWARRRSEARVGDRVAASVLTDWVLLDAEGRPTRIPREVESFADADASFAPARVALDEPAPGAAAVEVVVRPQDLDPLDHVNNATYLDYVEEALVGVGHRELLRRVPRRYRLEFAQPAAGGDRLTARLWSDRLGWSCRLDGPNDGELLRARLEVDPEAWVGG
jgi:acyl-ACP thioesterase